MQKIFLSVFLLIYSCLAFSQVNTNLNDYQHKCANIAVENQPNLYNKQELLFYLLSRSSNYMLIDNIDPIFQNYVYFSIDNLISDLDKEIFEKSIMHLLNSNNIKKNLIAQLSKKIKLEELHAIYVAHQFPLFVEINCLEKAAQYLLDYTDNEVYEEDLLEISSERKELLYQTMLATDKKIWVDFLVKDTFEQTENILNAISKEKMATDPESEILLEEMMYNINALFEKGLLYNTLYTYLPVSNQLLQDYINFIEDNEVLKEWDNFIYIEMINSFDSLVKEQEELLDWLVYSQKEVHSYLKNFQEN